MTTPNIIVDASKFMNHCTSLLNFPSFQDKTVNMLRKFLSQIYSKKAENGKLLHKPEGNNQNNLPHNNVFQNANCNHRNQKN